MDFARLGAALRARRDQLGMSQTELAKAAGLSLKTVQRAEAGVPMRSNTLAALDRGARWKPGGARAVASGGTALPDEPTSDLVQAGVMLLIEAAEIGHAEFMDAYRDVAAKLKAELGEERGSAVMAQVNDAYMARGR